jgi:membrane-bound metal-dependent hydrolase YbcI (DUF457 family)
MPDLLTHLAAARLPGVFLPDRRTEAFFLFGTFLPDLAAKAIQWGLRPPSVYTLQSHSLAGLLLLSYMTSLFVEERLRRRACVALFAGGCVHALVDTIKGYFGLGAVYPFQPFSTASLELGWISPENVVYLMPAAAVVLAFLAPRRRRPPPA